jgi:hypothetical protein
MGILRNVTSGFVVKYLLSKFYNKYIFENYP